MSPNVTPTAALTLLGTDTETIIAGMNMFHEVWSSLAEIAIATWLISRELGAACAMPIAVAVGKIVFIYFVRHHNLTTLQFVLLVPCLWPSRWVRRRERGFSLLRNEYQPRPRLSAV